MLLIVGFVLVTLFQAGLSGISDAGGWLLTHYLIGFKVLILFIIYYLLVYYRFADDFAPMN
jgi:hypothetical protein